MGNYIASNLARNPFRITIHSSAVSSLNLKSISLLSLILILSNNSATIYMSVRSLMAFHRTSVSSSTGRFSTQTRSPHLHQYMACSSGLPLFLQRHRHHCLLLIHRRLPVSGAEEHRPLPEDAADILKLDEDVLPASFAASRVTPRIGAIPNMVILAPPLVYPPPDLPLHLLPWTLPPQLHLLWSP